MKLIALPNKSNIWSVDKMLPIDELMSFNSFITKHDWIKDKH